MSRSEETQIRHLLTRNVEQVVERAHLEKALKSGLSTGLKAGKKLRVKLGIDPTAPDLHLGHTVVLWKLREFQELGHKIVLIIGDFTGRIGDPSGRSKTRPPLSVGEIKSNMKNYLQQAGLIIDVKRAEIRHNSEWLGKLRGADILRLLGQVSVQQILEREDFAKRLSEHKSVRVHEMLYPVMQAYDSVAIKADVELGGTDQTFNLLMGRVLMEKLGLLPQDILTVPLLVGLGGGEKMSKSLDNYVALNESPDEQFGKIMSLRDDLIFDYFRLTTRLSEKEITAYEKELKRGANPRDVKMVLAKEIVALYHDKAAADKAAGKWQKLFSKKETAGADIPVLKLKTKKLKAIDLVLESGVAKSKSEAWRLIKQGGLKVGGKTITDPRAALSLKGDEVVKVGKKKFFRTG